VAFGKTGLSKMLKRDLFCFVHQTADRSHKCFTFVFAYVENKKKYMTTVGFARLYLKARIQII